MNANLTLRNEVFLDAAYIIALSTPRDNYHEMAVELSALITRFRPKIVTSRGVLLEIGNSLSRLQYRRTSTNILSALENDARVEIVDLTAPLYIEALNLYSSRPDKEWGLTDCVSFTIMKQRGIKQALTMDNHFVQAGFLALMSDPTLR